MSIAYLSIGGNIGDRLYNLDIAKKYITLDIGEIIITSSIYETAAWGIRDQPDFLNQVLKIKTRLLPHRLLEKILSIENVMGRIRTQKNASRIIDIDILFFNDEIIDEPGIRVPHPEIQTRRFVLIPLNEIASKLIHPVLQQTIKHLLSTCDDALEVKLISK